MINGDFLIFKKVYKILLNKKNIFQLLINKCYHESHTKIIILTNFIFCLRFKVYDLLLL